MVLITRDFAQKLGFCTTELFLDTFHDLALNYCVAVNFVINWSQLPWVFTDKVCLPSFLEYGKFFKQSILFVFFSVVTILSVDLFNVSEWSAHNVYKVIVHEVSIISLKGNVCWLSSHRQEGDSGVHSVFFIFFRLLIFWQSLSSRWPSQFPSSVFTE